jgi:hypothetical protein
LGKKDKFNIGDYKKKSEEWDSRSRACTENSTRRDPLNLMPLVVSNRARAKMFNELQNIGRRRKSLIE